MIMITDNDIKKLKTVFLTKDEAKGFSTKNDLKKFATKDDLKRFATKDDLKRFATKEDLKRFATKDDLKMYATKDDLKNYPTKVDMKNEFQKYTDMVTKEMTELISVVIERIDAFKVSMDEKSNYQIDVINNHERRIEKLEERAYSATNT